jgi:hypothetical protein
MGFDAQSVCDAVAVGAAEGCDKAGTAFMGINRGDWFPVDRSLWQLLQGIL